MRGLRRASLGCVLAACLLAPSLRAHAIHTTVTQVTVDARGATFMIRAFADDLSAGVARHAGRPAPADFALSAAELLRYVQSQFVVSASPRGPLALESCGIRRADDMYWLCFRAPAARGLAGLSLRNQMLTEFHADQINIVQLDDRGRKQTMLFRKGSAASAVVSGD